MSMKKIAVLVTVVAVIVAVGAGYIVAAYAQEINNATSTQSVTPSMSWAHFKHKEFEKGFRWGLRVRSVEVSPEYNSTVMRVLESSPETSQLLNQGFSVEIVKPLIKAYVGANGEVTLKATQAVVVLSNSSAAYTYLVDISSNTVMLLSMNAQRTGCECVCKSVNH